MSDHRHGGPRWRLRAGCVLLLVCSGLLGAVAGLPRLARRNPKLLRLPIAKSYNGLTAKTAGSTGSPFGLLTHTGRRSGQTYRSPLGACAYGDGFLLPLAYGQRTDWYQNVIAAQACQLSWKGRTYALERPELVSGPSVLGAWSLRERITLRLSGIRTFVWLHSAEDTSS